MRLINYLNISAACIASCSLAALEMDVLEDIYKKNYILAEEKILNMMDDTDEHVAEAALIGMYLSHKDGDDGSLDIFSQIIDDLMRDIVICNSDGLEQNMKECPSNYP